MAERVESPKLATLGNCSGVEMEFPIGDTQLLRQAARRSRHEIENFGSGRTTIGPPDFVTVYSFTCTKIQSAFQADKVVDESTIRPGVEITNHPGVFTAPVAHPEFIPVDSIVGNK